MLRVAVLRFEVKEIRKETRKETRKKSSDVKRYKDIKGRVLVTFQKLVAAHLRVYIY